ncbi:hypothetical protein [Sphingomonas baiyangensis]|uniref:Polysaccharide chain length determinant N-terminal domain-containing protein n=1 Tax=Sphingomonas baiyangensis TaxID=2572576 RepID=A0A4U1L455_9SPHN|nr:hypothetical protein [Sphingomonas baiyangensis]TKD51030.1 hypothetical protein FBR43_09875 [Sphingomonas baiyangensis]
MMSLGETYLRIALSRWRIVVGLVLAGAALAWSVSVFYLAERPTFEAAARLNVVPTPEELGYASRFVRGSTFDGGSVLLGTYAEFARTRPVVEPIVDAYVEMHARAAGQTPPEWLAANTGPPQFTPGRILALLNYGAAPVKPLREDIIDTLLESTTIENVDGTYLVRLAVEWEDPQSAAWFANALSDAIIARAERLSRSRGQTIAGTLETRLEQKRGELAATLQLARRLKANVGVVDIDRQKQSLIEARLLEQALLTTDRANLDSARSQVAALRRQAGGRLGGAQQVLEQTLAVEAPRAAGLEQSVAARSERVAQIGAQIDTLSRAEDRIKLAEERAQALQAEVAALTERVSYSQTENLANAPGIDLIERAVPPLTRSSPKIFVNTVLGAIAGAALAACALLLLGPGTAKPLVWRRRREDEPAADEPVADAPEPELAPEPRPLADVHPIRPLPTVASTPATTHPPARISGQIAHSGFGKDGVAQGNTASARPAAQFLQRGSAALATQPEPQSEPETLVPIAAAAAVPEATPSPAIAAESEAAPAHRIDGPALGWGDCYHETPLPAPAAGDAYSTEESATLGAMLAAWIGRPLAGGPRPIFVTAVESDADAQRVYRLLYDQLRRARFRVRTIDAGEPDAAQRWALPNGKALVYLGAIGGSADPELLACLPADAVLIVANGSGEEAWRPTDPAIALPAHVVPLAR